MLEDNPYTGVGGCNGPVTRRGSLRISGAATLTLLLATSSAFGADRATSVDAGNSLAAVLRTDPRFTTFVRFIRFAGLGFRHERATDLTVFAPTNEAFDKTFPHWRAQIVPDQTTNGNAAGFHRQQVIRSAVIRGVHPPSDFMGKVQMVKSIGGTVFQVDGRTPGVLLLSIGGSSPQTGIGFDQPKEQVAHLALPPIQSARFVIYPTDAIIVPHK